MTSFEHYGRDGTQSAGDLHPEVAEASLACLKRDLRRLRHTQGKAFLRRPYTDLQEVEMVAVNHPALQISEIVGVAVVPLVEGDTNARMPLTAEQVAEEVRCGRLIDLWTSRGFG